MQIDSTAAVAKEEAKAEPEDQNTKEEAAEQGGNVKLDFYTNVLGAISQKMLSEYSV